MPITLTCLGAAGTVTGSRHLLDTGSARMLVDCGLFQERHLQDHNWDPFIPPAGTIDALVLTHAHIDHCGLLPRLHRQGFDNDVFCTRATADLVPILLADSARLQVEDALSKVKRHRREGRTSPRGEVRPLYDEEDAARACRLLRGVDLDTTVAAAPGIGLRFQHAGHVLGSASVLATLAGPPACRILFSGDLGRRDRPLIPDPVDPPAAEVVVIESTYGDRLHEPGGDTAIEDALAKVLDQAIRQSGPVLVPCFAVERAQELLWYLGRLKRAGRIPAWLPIYLDSPMAIDLLRVFRNHPEACDPWIRGDELQFPGLRLISSPEQSKAINAANGPFLVIAGSGMCTGGRIKHHLFHRLADPAVTVMFVGYQANGTLGRQILEGASQVRIFGSVLPVRAQVAQIRGFSGHADQNELLDWLQRLPAPPRQVLVVHGGSQVAAGFAQLITNRFGWPARAPALGEQVLIAG